MTISGQVGGHEYLLRPLPNSAVAFSVRREFNGNSIVLKYEGKLDGDTIKGTSERPSRGGGAPQKRDWSATRVK